MKLSNLLKIGVRWISINDDCTFILFKDGSYLKGRQTSGRYSEQTPWADSEQVYTNYAGKKEILENDVKDIELKFRNASYWD